MTRLTLSAPSMQDLARYLIGDTGTAVEAQASGPGAAPSGGVGGRVGNRINATGSAAATAPAAKIVANEYDVRLHDQDHGGNACLKPPGRTPEKITGRNTQ